MADGRAIRPHTERPLYKMSVQLIDTYKLINKVYYEKKAKRKVAQRAAEASSEWDDENYDYVLNIEDNFGEHYVIKERIGKGSFGQVVRAHDTRTRTDVAIKIIKSKKPFAIQARGGVPSRDAGPGAGAGRERSSASVEGAADDARRGGGPRVRPRAAPADEKRRTKANTEIELLRALRAADRDDKQNIVRLLHHFEYRGHKCLVFEMLSSAPARETDLSRRRVPGGRRAETPDGRRAATPDGRRAEAGASGGGGATGGAPAAPHAPERRYNLYELLKNTQFHGVSLNLVRKFAKQILHALAFLARPDVAVIHCDLKPENILLRHPKRSAIKVIDFGSSCRSDKRMRAPARPRGGAPDRRPAGTPTSSRASTARPRSCSGCPTRWPSTSGASAASSWRCTRGSRSSRARTSSTRCGGWWTRGAASRDSFPPAGAGGRGAPRPARRASRGASRRRAQVLGMPPESMIEASEKANREQYFVPNAAAVAGPGVATRAARGRATDPPPHRWTLRARKDAAEAAKPAAGARPRGLAGVVGVGAAGPGGRRRGEPGHGEENYRLFLDLVRRMLEYSPSTRVKPADALRGPASGEQGAVPRTRADVPPRRSPVPGRRGPREHTRRRLHDFLDDAVWAATHGAPRHPPPAARPGGAGPRRRPRSPPNPRPPQQPRHSVAAGPGPGDARDHPPRTPASSPDRRRATFDPEPRRPPRTRGRAAEEDAAAAAAAAAAEPMDLGADREDDGDDDRPHICDAGTQT